MLVEQTGPAPNPVYRFGSFVFTPREGELRRNHRRVRLQGQPMRILLLLLDKPGELVTRDALRQNLWPADTFVDFDMGVNTAMRKLRRALGDSTGRPRYIETQPRRGYRFIAPVSLCDASLMPKTTRRFHITESEVAESEPATAALPSSVELSPALFDSSTTGGENEIDWNFWVLPQADETRRPRSQSMPSRLAPHWRPLLAGAGGTLLFLLMFALRLHAVRDLMHPHTPARAVQQLPAQH